MPDSPGQDSDASGFIGWLSSLVPAAFPSDNALARAAGVSGSTVWRWRRGARPDAAALLKLSAVTGTRLDILLKLAGYQPEDAS